ncbi:MAG TPA: hypothetical protein VFU57_10745, partial [Candidatus Acidoferrales bacterium]|nr:hypothetical protein [Candidatus Acidoferrales bacterium]
SAFARGAHANTNKRATEAIPPRNFFTEATSILRIYKIPRSDSTAIYVPQLAFWEIRSGSLKLQMLRGLQLGYGEFHY